MLCLAVEAIYTDFRYNKKSIFEYLFIFATTARLYQMDGRILKIERQAIGAGGLRGGIRKNDYKPLL